MGNVEFQVGDRVRLQDGLASVQGVLSGEVGDVTWVEQPSGVVGPYRVNVRFVGRELEMFDTDLVLVG
jgi:hypothetical protein